MTARNLFQQSPIGRVIEALGLTLMDVGARGGVDEDLRPAAWATAAIGFEPEPEECARLNDIARGPWKSTRYVPTALGSRDGQATLNLPASGEGASLLPHNSDMLARFGHAALHHTMHQLPVETRTLDSAVEAFRLPEADYLKIDVEGAELDILRAAPRTLAHCAAAKVEVSFLEQRVGQPLAQEVVAFMLESGFVLAEIRGVHSWRRRPLPAHPYSAQWSVPYSRGIAAQCDLVFLREPQSLLAEEAKVRLLVVAAILGFFDHAVGVLRENREIEKKLNQQIKGDCIVELGRISRSMGRQAAMTEIKSRLRSLVPLLRSILAGLPSDRSAAADY
ncbi:FkbM family methyltransferase [Methylolobus aquaticus]